MATLPEYRPHTNIDCRPASCAWRVIRHGFNVEGRCQNSHCPAHKSMVVINAGFGEFDLARVVLQEKYFCPICNTKIKPIKYGLSHCQWWYVDHYSTVMYPLNQVKDGYELTELNCDYIIIEVMPLPKTSQINIRESADISCPICLTNLATNGELIELQCLHTYHRHCIKEWLQSDQSMAGKCPMCREYIVESD